MGSDVECSLDRSEDEVEGCESKTAGGGRENPELGTLAITLETGLGNNVLRNEVERGTTRLQEAGSDRLANPRGDVEGCGDNEQGTWLLGDDVCSSPGEVTSTVKLRNGE